MKSKNKKALTVTALTIVYIVAIVIFKVLHITSENIIFDFISTALLSLAKIPLVLFIAYKLFKNYLRENSKGFLIASGIGLFISNCFEIARILTSPGKNAGVLFFPISLPVAIFSFIYFYSKSADHKKGKLISFLAGIPLLLVSIYFEIYDFLQ